MSPELLTVTPPFSLKKEPVTKVSEKHPLLKASEAVNKKHQDEVKISENEINQVVTYDANSQKVVTQIRDTTGRTLLQFPNMPFRGK